VVLTVMTRNLYLGADLIPAAAATDEQQLRQAATAIVDHVRATDFPARAKLIAAEVAQARPDVLALQEVATWRRGPGGAPARTVVYDWLRLLRRRLAARHLHYRLVAAKQEFDFQLPTTRGYDARLTLRDAILAGPRVKVRSTRSAGFRHILSIPTLAGQATIHRSYNALAATVGGARFRLVNTHLEAYSATIRAQQAKEVVAGPLAGRGPVILAGDLNSDKVPAQPGDTLAYQAIAAAGFVDRASRRPSCCHDDSTLRKRDRFDHIVDHVMSRPRLRVVRTSVTGDRDRTPEGLWPSDHGGVVVTLRLP
jgi:endonuclease/exonuclease/phosphatase family metal-dependent hydrolase